MKKLLTLCLLAVTATAYASTDNDTLTIEKPRKVDIITGDSVQKIKVYGREGNDNYTYENSIQLVDSNYVSETTINKDWGFSVGILGKQKKPSWGYPYEGTSLSMHLGLGLCSAIGASDPVAVSVGSSWEIMWTIAEWMRYQYGRHDGYSIGFGIGWRNYRMTGFHHFTKASDGTIGTERYPDGTEPDFSRIKVFSLQVPIMWQHRFNKRWGFALGPVINFNTYASIKNRYTDVNGDKQKELFKNIHQQPITIDLMLNVNIMNVFNVYCKYSPMNILRSSYTDNTKFQSLSFGIYL